MVCRANTPVFVCSSQASAGRIFSSTSDPREQRRRDDVEVAVTVHVGRLGAMDAGHLRQGVLDERKPALFSSHWMPVIRLHDPVVEGVAVGEQDVDVAVLVEINQLEARRAPVRVRGRVDDLLLEREVAGAPVDVREHGLVLLGEQRHEVRFAVAIQIDRHHLDAARAWIDRVGRERRLRNVGRAVFENRDLSGLAPPERGNGEIDLAVAIEVRRADVATRGQPSSQNAPNLPPAGRASRHGALRVVGRKELAHLGHQQILGAVPIDVGNGDMGRVRNTGNSTSFAAGSPGLPLKTVPWRMSVPMRSSRPSSSRSIKRTCDTAGVPGIPGASMPRR